MNVEDEDLRSNKERGKERKNLSVCDTFHTIQIEVFGFAS